MAHFKKSDDLVICVEIIEVFQKAYSFQDRPSEEVDENLWMKFL